MANVSGYRWMTCFGLLVLFCVVSVRRYVWARWEKVGRRRHAILDTGLGVGEKGDEAVRACLGEHKPS